MSRVATVAVALSIIATTATAQSRFAVAGITDDRIVITFITALQRAVARDDRRAVSAMIRYPINVLVGGMRMPVADANAMVQHYDLIFTPPLKAVIAQTDVGPQARRDGSYRIEATSEGLALGTGLIRMTLIEGALRISEITVPLASPGSDSAQAPAAAPRRAGTTHFRSTEPRRVVFRAGHSTTRLSGLLEGSETESFVVWANRGQLLEVRLEGVRGRDVVARVLEAKSRAAVDARADMGARAWAARVMASADYRIDVVRGNVSGASTQPYVIVIGVR